MGDLRGIITGSAGTFILCGACAGGWWIANAPQSESKKEKPPAPAIVAKPVNESDLLTVELRPEAEQRLDLRVGTIERKSLPRERVYGGEVMVATGRSVLVSAPLNGVLSAVPGEVTQPGELVKRGQPILSLRPLLTPDSHATLSASRVDADGQVKTGSRRSKPRRSPATALGGCSATKRGAVGRSMRRKPNTISPSKLGRRRPLEWSC